MIIKREKYLKIIKNFLGNKDKILFLVGARQVGKTTLLKSLLEFNILSKNDTLWINGDELDIEFETGQQFIEYLKLKYNFSEKINYLIIDEFHFIKNIGKILKNLIDNIRIGKYSFKIICCGSGSWNVFQGKTDSLIGRYDIVKIYPFSFGEICKYKGLNFDLINKDNIKVIFKDLQIIFEEYINFGGYPEVVISKDIEEKKYILSNLLNNYLYKDVSIFLKSGEFINFKKFLKVIAQKLGSVYNISDIAGEIGISRYIFEKYLLVVENTFLVYRLTGIKTGFFSGEIENKEKIYFNDIGFLRYILGGGEFVGDIKGKIVENFVYNHLILNLPVYKNVYFRRRTTGAEIDFVIYDNFKNIFLPMEVKTGKKDNIPKALSNFVKIVDNCKKGIVFYGLADIKNREIENKYIKFLPYFLAELNDLF